MTPDPQIVYPWDTLGPPPPECWDVGCEYIQWYQDPFIILLGISIVVGSIIGYLIWKRDLGPL